MIFLTNYGDDLLRIFNRLLLLAVLCSFNALPQFTAKIMTYNVLNYPGSTAAQRNPYFITIMNAVQPDIVVIGEMASSSAVSNFLNNVMKPVFSDYAMGTFIDGPDTDHGIIYRSSKFNFISTTPISTALRNIDQYKLNSISTLDTLLIYAVHLKASNDTTDRVKRSAEVDSLRKVTDKLHPGANFIVLGDFNIYKSTEVAYQKLLNSTKSGYFLDWLKDSLTVTWNNSANAKYHTQSPRLRSFDGGITGGLDDRFDMILMSQTVWDIGGIRFIPGSMVAYGNDGNHYNDSINSPPNTAVGQTIADAIHYASDHIPVFASFSFDTPLPVELVSFSGVRTSAGIKLLWKTATEINNYGFDIERSSNSSEWITVGFIEGHNNSNSPRYYEYIDKTKEAGKLYYRLKQIDNDGTTEYSNTIEIRESIPSGFNLDQNYPNPFNPETRISYTLPESGHVALRVFDMIGSEVATIQNGEKEAGRHEVDFIPKGLAAGNYIYRLSWNGFSLSGKMLYLP